MTGVSLCRRTIYDDPFIRNYIEDLLENIRTQVCISIFASPSTALQACTTTWRLALPLSVTGRLTLNICMAAKKVGMAAVVTGTELH